MFSLKFKTSVLSKQAIKAFQNTSFSKVAVVIRFPAKKKNAGCTKAPRDFPPRKDGILHPPSGCLGTLLPLPQSLYGWAYADVATKISRNDRLRNLLSNGAPLSKPLQQKHHRFLANITDMLALCQLKILSLSRDSRTLAST